MLSKKPVELHRFYKDESTFCHASGTKEEVSFIDGELIPMDTVVFENQPIAAASR